VLRGVPWVVSVGATGFVEVSGCDLARVRISRDQMRNLIIDLLCVHFRKFLISVWCVCVKRVLDENQLGNSCYLREMNHSFCNRVPCACVFVLLCEYLPIFSKLSADFRLYVVSGKDV